MRPRDHYRCGHPFKRCTRCELISALQRGLPPVPVTLRQRGHYLRSAAWWELEVMRGYESSARSAAYARNMRWCAEVTLTHGPGTYLELKARFERDGDKWPNLLEAA